MRRARPATRACQAASVQGWLARSRRRSHAMPAQTRKAASAAPPSQAMAHHSGHVPDQSGDAASAGPAAGNAR